MDIAAVNALSFEDFVDVFGNVVERCPVVVAAVWQMRPFSDLRDLEGAISGFIDCLPESGKAGILRCHPDLAGRDFQRGTLTPESGAEQAQVGLDALSPAEAARIGDLNRAYKERFGFPFVICAKLTDKATILRQLAERLRGDPAAEVTRGVGEVKKICALRLRSLVCSDTHNKL